MLLAHGAERREVGVQSVKRELEDRHRAGHVSKLMASEIDERRPARRHRRIVRDVIGHHDLASVCHRHHPGAPVQRRPEEMPPTSTDEPRWMPMRTFSGSISDGSTSASRCWASSAAHRASAAASNTASTPSPVCDTTEPRLRAIPPR